MSSFVHLLSKNHVSSLTEIQNVLAFAKSLVHTEANLNECHQYLDIGHQFLKRFLLEMNKVLIPTARFIR